MSGAFSSHDWDNYGMSGGHNGAHEQSEGPPIHTMMTPEQDAALLQDIQWLYSASALDSGVTSRIEATIARVKGMTCTNRLVARLRAAFGGNAAWVSTLLSAALGAVVTLAGLTVIAVAIAVAAGLAVGGFYVLYSAHQAKSTKVAFVDPEVRADPYLDSIPKDALKKGAPVNKALWDSLFALSNILTVYDPVHLYAVIHLLAEDRDIDGQRSDDRVRYELRILAIVEMHSAATEKSMLLSAYTKCVKQFVFKQISPGGKFQTRVAHCQAEADRRMYPILTRHPDHNPSTMWGRLFRSKSAPPQRRAFEVDPPEIALGRACPELQEPSDLMSILEVLNGQAQRAPHSSFTGNGSAFNGGGCWLLPYNLALKNDGIAPYLRRAAVLAPPPLIKDTVVSMLGIAATMETSYGRLHFKMSYQLVGDRPLTFGHVRVIQGALTHDQRTMSEDGHDHVRLFARRGVLTTMDVGWGVGGEPSEGLPRSKELLTGARKSVSHALKKAFSGPLLGGVRRSPSPELGGANAVQSEVARIMWVLKDNHADLIVEFAKAADAAEDALCSVVVSVVLASHHDSLKNKQKHKHSDACHTTDSAPVGNEIEGHATRFVAVAAGLLYVCKPVVSVDSPHDVYRATAATMLNPKLYFDRILACSSFYRNDISFKHYFAATDVSSTLTAVPTLASDVLAHVENIWGTYSAQLALSADVEPDLT